MNSINVAEGNEKADLASSSKNRNNITSNVPNINTAQKRPLFRNKIKMRLLLANQLDLHDPFTRL